MTIFAQAPVPEHHRLDRGTTINLTGPPEAAAPCDHPGGLASHATCPRCLPDGLTKAQADTYSAAYDAASAAMLAPHGDTSVLAVRVYGARLWMRDHPEASLATAADALVGRWDAYNDACRALFPAVRAEVLVMENLSPYRGALPSAGHAEARALTQGVSALPTSHVYASASATCPAWCTEHVGGDAGWRMHDSGEMTVPVTGGGPNERGRLYVNVERSDGPGQPIGTPSIRLDGNRGPMTPLEALQLAATLQAAAFAALIDVDAGRGRNIDWALSLLDEPTPSVAMRHGYTVEQATKMLSIVADLVAQMEAEDAAEREGGQA